MLMSLMIVLAGLLKMQLNDLKGIPWDTPIKPIPLKDFETIRLLGRKQIMKNIGLYDKYIISVTHKDGKEVDPNKEFLVIELTDPDPREFEAALQFARICDATGYIELAKDIFRKLYIQGERLHYIECENFIAAFGPYPTRIANSFMEQVDPAENADMYETDICDIDGELND